MGRVVSDLEESYLEALYEYLLGELVSVNTVVSRMGSRLPLAPEVHMESKPNIVVKFGGHYGMTISLDMVGARVKVRRWRTQGIRFFELADPTCFEQIVEWVRSYDGC